MAATKESLLAKVLDLLREVNGFDEWDAEADGPRTKEVELDDVWKLVVVTGGGFRTVKIHEIVPSF